MPPRLRWSRVLGTCALTGMVGAFAVHLEGCTVLGFTAGALVDMSNGKGGPQRLINVRPNTRVTVWTTDGRKRDGLFTGILDADDSLLVGPQPPLPPGARIRLEDHEMVETIAADSILRVSVPVASGKVIGTLVGLSADVIVVVAAEQSVGSSAPDCGRYSDPYY